MEGTISGKETLSARADSPINSTYKPSPGVSPRTAPTTMPDNKAPEKHAISLKTSTPRSQIITEPDACKADVDILTAAKAPLHLKSLDVKSSPRANNADDPVRAANRDQIEEAFMSKRESRAVVALVPPVTDLATVNSSARFPKSILHNKLPNAPTVAPTPRTRQISVPLKKSEDFDYKHVANARAIWVRANRASKTLPKRNVFKDADDNGTIEKGVNHKIANEKDVGDKASSSQLVKSTDSAAVRWSKEPEKLIDEEESALREEATQQSKPSTMYTG